MTSVEVHTSMIAVDASPAEALAALFDDGLDTPSSGPELAPLWHWVALPRWSPASATGNDGHPRTGGFLPDLGKPRRMFAGGAVEFLAPIRIGTSVRIEERVVSVVAKSGRMGDFFLVQTETNIFDESDSLAVVERRDLVYRDAAPPGGDSVLAPPALVGRPLLERFAGGWRFHTDPSLLMRFSSATSNGHRIHYDYPYATQAEGYPGLVVHGPLMTLSMAEVLRLEGVDDCAVMTHRNLRPLFCGQDAEIVVEQLDEELEVNLRSDEGTHVTLRASRHKARS